MVCRESFRYPHKTDTIVLTILFAIKKNEFKLSNTFITGVSLLGNRCYLFFSRFILLANFANNSATDMEFGLMEMMVDTLVPFSRTCKYQNIYSTGQYFL